MLTCILVFSEGYLTDKCFIVDEDKIKRSIVEYTWNKEQKSTGKIGILFNWPPGT